ncbi:MAG: hypothetical protein QXH91_02390 [Candidatus Bathyarchaeia archaeon]
MIDEILIKADLEPVSGDMEFIKKAEEVASACEYRPIELSESLGLFSLKEK